MVAREMRARKRQPSKSLRPPGQRIQMLSSQYHGAEDGDAHALQPALKITKRQHDATACYRSELAASAQNTRAYEIRTWERVGNPET